MQQTLRQTINRPRYIIGTAIIIAAVITVIELAHIYRQRSPVITYQCFKSSNGWGYDILAKNKIIIHQDVIGSFPGATGFSSEQQAGAVAAIVIEKIKSGKIPAISRSELQQLGVISTP
jgi:hypothetical protein